MQRRAWLATAAATMIGVLAIGSTAGGFGTVTKFGQHAEHEKITRAALACTATGAPQTCFQPKSIFNLAGGPGTFGAVGSPDSDEVFNSDAHCDDADFLDRKGYRQTRSEATTALLACRAHLKRRFREAVTAADRLLTGRFIAKAGVDLGSSCTYFAQVGGRAKCDTLEGFGRALHGAEDFYSHSNWADAADPSEPVSTSNPPGLLNPGVAPVLNLRAIGVTVPEKLSTGCFVALGLLCGGRVSHSTMNKDKGIIDPVTGATRDPSTARGKVGTNFQRAVTGAIAEARRQWDDLSVEIMARYATPAGNQIICALTRDNPVTDCSGKRLVIVGGGPGANAAADALNRSLLPRASSTEGDVPDQSASIALAPAAVVVSPLGDPLRTSFNGFDDAGQLDPAASLQAAIQELTKDPNADLSHAGIVLITAGQDGSHAMLDALRDAGRRGIRVSVGVLSPAPEQPVRRANYASTVISLGGSYAVIDSAAARDRFVDLVSRNGLTVRDDPRSRPAGGSLVAGLTTTGLAATFPRTWHHHIPSTVGEADLRVVSDPGTQLSVVIHDVRMNKTVFSGTSDPGGVVSGQFAHTDDLALVITSPSGAVIPYTVRINDSLPLGVQTTGDDAMMGAAHLEGGPGNDVIAVSPSGTEEVDGGPGNDTVIFPMKRPKGVTCKSTDVPVGKKHVTLKGVEQVLYDDVPCSAPALPEPELTSGAKVAAVPPKPTVKATSTSKQLTVTVHVSASTSIAVVATVGSKTLEPVTRLAPKAGDYRFKLPRGSKAGAATVKVTTIGVAGGPTKTGKVQTK